MGVFLCGVAVVSSCTERGKCLPRKWRCRVRDSLASAWEAGVGAAPLMGGWGQATSPEFVTSSIIEIIVCLKNAGYVRVIPVHFKSWGNGLHNIENSLHMICHFEWVTCIYYENIIHSVLEESLLGFLQSFFTISHLLFWEIKPYYQLNKGLF